MVIGEKFGTFEKIFYNVYKLSFQKQMKNINNKKFDIFSKTPETIESSQKLKDENEFIRPQISQFQSKNKLRRFLYYLLLASIAYLLAQFLSYWLQKRTQDSAKEPVKFSAFKVDSIESDSMSTAESNLSLRTSSVISTTTTSTSAQVDSVNKDIKIRILNGNGIPKDAKKYQSVLTSAGFDVGKIGNATKQNYEIGIIYYLSGKKNQAELAQVTLSDKSFILEEGGVSLIGSGYDILVIVGVK